MLGDFYRSGYRREHGAEADVELASAWTQPQRTGEEVEVVTTGRLTHVGIRATPIAEAMLALVLMDHLMRQRAESQWLDDV